MKKKLPFVALFLVVVGFIVWKYVHRPVTLEKQPIILGHGGMGVRSPYTLDSKRSVEVALDYPIEGTEIDVRMTADSVLIAFHDEEFPIHSGCPGEIWNKSYPEIYACSHGVFHKAEPVPSLDSLLASGWKDGTIFSLDLKPENDINDSRLAAFSKQIIIVVNQFPQFRFLVEAQNVKLLQQLKAANIKADVFYYGQTMEEARAIITENEFDGVSINAAFITKEQIQDAQNDNVQVMIWGTGSVFSNRKFLELEADIIQTDAIKSMVMLLER